MQLVINKKKTVAFKTASKNMCIGDTYTFRLVNKPSGAKYTWKSSKQSIATLSSKGVVKAKKVGTTQITCKVKTKSKTVTLKANVKVSDSITVSTQKELNSALKAKKAKTVTIKTKANIKLNIPKGDYSNKELVVDAPKATITNSGVFKDIKLNNIKPHTWKERAKGNKITVLCNASIIVEKTADVAISVTKANVDVIFQLFGKATIKFTKGCDVIIDGSVDSTVQITSNAETSIKTKIPVKILQLRRLNLNFRQKMLQKLQLR